MPFDTACHTIDWTHDTRSEWDKKHRDFDALMNLALIEAHVTPLDLDSLFEPEPDEPPVCKCCDGRGYLFASDPRRPWREMKQACWECM